MIRKSILLCASAVALTACVAAPRFEYGAYEPTLYAYYKKPELADKFETALEKAIEKGEASDRLAPGLYAELGYLKLNQGDQATAVQLFRKEAEAFPESEVFMSGIVSRLTDQNAEAALQESAVEPEQVSDETVNDGKSTKEAGV